MTAGLGRPRQGLVLAAMIFAVAMTFIDQTIVSIAAPQIQRELGLSTTGTQWAVNAYLLAMAALFALGGRLADTLGQRRMVVTGVIIFAAASALCGLAPSGGFAQAWVVTFRAVQGAGAALLYPAALAVVVDTFPIERRGRALAVFFAVAGGLTAVGPIAGGYLTEWTWRAIFWVNVPVALIALVLIAAARPAGVVRPRPMDYRGFALITAGIALSVVGFQQAQFWGWHSPGVWLCVAAGFALLAVFGRNQARRIGVALLDVRLLRDRVFLVQNLVLGVAMLAFVPVFFFASQYAQVSLGDSSSDAGIFLLYFFLGFVVAAQVGGRMLDEGGAKRPVVLGCALAAVGFYLWAGQVGTLSFSAQQWYVIMAGAGFGLMLGPASTAAVSRADAASYGQATGITQTVRNYAAALGLAVLGSVLLSDLRSRLTDTLRGQGAGPAAAKAQAGQIAQSLQHPAPGGSGGSVRIPHFLATDFAHSTHVVLLAMAVLMAISGVLALVGLPAGRQTGPVKPAATSRPAIAPDAGPDCDPDADYVECRE